MIGFIKKLFSGIISFFTGLFGNKKPQANQLQDSSASKPANNGNKQKRNGYFMELDETKEQSANGSQSAKAAVSEAAKTVAEATKASVSDAAKTVKSAVANVADKNTATKAEKPAVADKASATKTAKPATANKSAAKPEPVKTQSVSLPDKSLKVEMVQTDKGLKEEVKAEPAKSNKSNGQAPAEKTFAPKYLMPSNSNSRRRPGPSMSNFLDMARQVKTPG